jgi:hypothetical protein
MREDKIGGVSEGYCLVGRNKERKRNEEKANMRTVYGTYYMSVFSE